MNIENIKRVRDQLANLAKQDKLAEQFNMGHLVEYFKDYLDIEGTTPPVIAMREGACNTSACICGWAVVLLGDEQRIRAGEGLWPMGVELFGLTDAQAQELFAPWDMDDEEQEAKYPDDIAYEVMNATPSQAVKVLDHLIATGDIDWNKAF